MKKKAPWTAIILVVFLGSMIGIGAGVFVAKWVSLSRLHVNPLSLINRNPFGDQRYVRLLMIGVDNTGNASSGDGCLSDTLVVMSIDTKTKEIRALSIPRDTMVEIPNYGTKKINSAHALGGVKLSKSTIESITKVPIDYYIKTTTKGLVGLVDLLGGVYIVVDKDMNYDDNRGNLHIHLKGSPEKQLLNGVQAMGYVRFRHDAVGDSGFIIKDGKKVPAGRVVRQQYFMRAMVNRVLSLPSKTKRAEFLQKAMDKQYLQSDLEAASWMAIAEYLKDFKPESMKIEVLPGAPGTVHRASYWIPDKDEVTKAVDRTLNFIDPPEPQIVTSPASTPAPVRRETPVKLEILNGSGKPGLAKTAATYFESVGFIVVKTGNAPNFRYNNSKVINHKVEDAEVQKVLDILKSKDVTHDSNSNSQSDITIIIGKDYQGA